MSVPAWLRVVLVAGLLYLVIGLGTADLARLSGVAAFVAAWVIVIAVRELNRPTRDNS